LLDLSPASLRVAVESFAAAGVPAPECFQMNVLKSDLPPGQFDIIWNGGVIEHFSDEGKALLIREMLRLAKPGGKVIIMVPNAWRWPFHLTQAWKKWRGTWSYGFEDDMSPRRLNRMARSLGLERTETYAFNPVVGWF